MDNDTQNSLWAIWLIVLSCGVIIGGICFSFIFPFILPQGIELFYTEITGTKFNELPDTQIKFHNLLSGVIGGVMIGWGLILLILGFRLKRQPEEWMWTVVAISVVVWYITDTLTSVLAGSMLNVLLNTSILVFALPPLIANWRKILNGLADLI